MNKKFNQTAGQIAQKSYLSCVVRATDIAREAYNNSHQFNLSTEPVTKNVASPAQNEPVIGLEDRLLLTCCTLPIAMAMVTILKLVKFEGTDAWNMIFQKLNQNKKIQWQLGVTWKVKGQNQKLIIIVLCYHGNTYVTKIQV